MSISRCQNLPGPLERVTASYHEPAASSRLVRTATAAQRASQLAAYMDLVLDDPRAAHSLHDANVELRDGAGLAAALPKALDGAMSFMGAEAGNIQIRDPGDDSLVLVTQLGFGHEYLDHFAVVDGDHSVCGRAAAQGAQAVVADVQDDPALTPHRSVFRAAGVRAVQSTPLLDDAGQMVGMLSTTMPEPGRPPDRTLQTMRHYSRLAGEVIARHLGRSFPGNPHGHSHGTTALVPPELASVQLPPVVLPVQGHTVGTIRAHLESSARQVRAFADELHLVSGDELPDDGSTEAIALLLAGVCRTLAKNWGNGTPITDERVREFNREIEFLGALLGVPNPGPLDGRRLRGD
jgi:hypothetical protein